MDITPEHLRTLIGKPVPELPTPSLILSHDVVEKNCKEMLDTVDALGIGFRAHVKTHKTVEGTRMMLGGKHKKVVVSTLREARGLAGLINEGVVDDILYGLPCVPGALPELDQLSQKTTVRLMVDHESHVAILKSFPRTTATPWSVFIKVDMGSHRAGLPVSSESLRTLVAKVLAAAPRVTLHGFYCHAGHSYGSRSKDDAAGILNDEISAAIAASETVNADTPLTLSVGSTPTAHVIASAKQALPQNRSLELHGGNYPINDLQQLATGCIDAAQQAMRVLAEVCSIYPERNEALVNAGVIALSREAGQLPGYGRLATAPQWIVGRLSQEHGILVLNGDRKEKVGDGFRVGQKVLLHIQHACITAAAYGWYFVVDSEDVVRDVWFPWKGW